MKTSKDLQKLFEDAKECNDSLLVIRVDENHEEVEVACTGASDSISAVIATILDDGYGEQLKDGSKEIADAILKGITVATSIPTETSLVIAAKVAMAAGKAMEYAENGLFNISDILKAKQAKRAKKAKKEEEEDDCETCDERFECPLPAAIAYRKENHIPAPKSNRGKNKSKKK